ncbi:MAG TPA: sigma-54 dependent transcriptional regulator [Bryobacteraceae bacterium]|nr:sigma-54 dependent transcriptional regulator [Bryobacteraceae bacterium]
MKQGAVDQNCVFLGMPAVIASEPMLRLMATVERVARSQATVLIQGESGTGKEVVARAVHHYSMRSQRPWVDLSCAALPEHLIESELFGYERGAFSGADSSKPGLFELAHQGTIFLDEIAELDMKMQVKLLRVLDRVPYYRLGGVKKVTVDVRVVAATNQDLEAAMAEGRFRSDLYHRLSQITLHVPPLRQRVDDIVPLAAFFLEEQSPGRRFAPDAERALETHSWPGNIRELRNAITKAAVLAPDDLIHATDLPLHPAHSSDFTTAPAPSVRGWNLHNGRPQEHSASNPAGMGSAYRDSSNLNQMERQLILEALAATGGHQQRAAARLGISRRTLSRKLKLYETEGVRLPA